MGAKCWNRLCRAIGAECSASMFRGDAAFANPEIYELLEAEGMGYAIRLPANRVLQEKIGHLLKCPVGRPPHEVRCYYSSFRYRAGSCNKPRRVVAKDGGAAVADQPGEADQTNVSRIPIPLDLIFRPSRLRRNEIRPQPTSVTAKSFGFLPRRAETRGLAFIKAHLCRRRLSHLTRSPGHAAAGGARSRAISDRISGAAAPRPRPSGRSRSDRG